MAIDDVVLTRELLSRYEGIKKRYFLVVLGNIRSFKASGDEDKVKGELEVLLKMLPRFLAVIKGEINKFSDFQSIVVQIEEQKRLLSELDMFSRLYIKNNDKGRLNDFYNKISEIIKKFIYNSELIEKTKIPEHLKFKVAA